MYMTQFVDVSNIVSNVRFLVQNLTNAAYRINFDVYFCRTVALQFFWAALLQKSLTKSTGGFISIKTRSMTNISWWRYFGSFTWAVLLPKVSSISAFYVVFPFVKFIKRLKFQVRPPKSNSVAGTIMIVDIFSFREWFFTYSANILRRFENKPINVISFRTFEKSHSQLLTFVSLHLLRTWTRKSSFWWNWVLQSSHSYGKQTLMKIIVMIISRYQFSTYTTHKCWLNGIGFMFVVNMNHEITLSTVFSFTVITLLRKTSHKLSAFDLQTRMIEK